MQRGHLDDLLAFLAVAREQSFTRAAAKLGVSQSALSHTMRELEARLGVRLLARTTRRVAPTEAGERLVQSLGPRFEEIEAELGALRELRDKPAGTIRITATEYAADAVLLPKLSKLLRDYPDIKVEITMDYGLTDRRWRLDEFILAPPVSSAFTAKLGIPADLVESERRK